MSAARRPLYVLLAGLLGAASAPAEREGYTYLSYADADVTLASVADPDAAARPNLPILAGDVLATGPSARAEAILADGCVVRVDGRTEVRFDRLGRTYESDDDRTVLVLGRGAVALDVPDPESRERAFRLDTDDATIVASSRASFRVDAGRRGTAVWVTAGRVELNARGGRALVRAGESAFASGDAAVDVEEDAAPRDRFAAFVEARRERAEARPTSRYVDPDYAYDAGAAGLEDYGTWAYSQDADAWAWRPEVPDGWTPYALGSWRWSPAGLTWVSDEPWGWLPYHYGTWFHDASLGWMWGPGPAYAPAWVYWGSAPGWTGWCPAGWVDGYRRVARPWTRGGLVAPRGSVPLERIDRRGWSFTSTGRIGARLDPARDVVRGERVPLPKSQAIAVSSGPLRIDRSARPGSAVPEAVRRAPSAPARGQAPVRADDAWRTSGSSTRGTGKRPVERRDRGGDSGWRAPSPRVVERPPARRDAEPSRAAPRREAPAPRPEASAPRHDAPAPRPEAPAPRRER